MALSYERLRELFTQLGADDPESWARSAANETIPQLVRFVLLRSLWACVHDDDDRWMHQWADPRTPIPSAIRRMLACGIDASDLTDVVRDAQMLTLFNVCQALDNPVHGIEDLQKSIPENVEWRVVEYDGERERIGRLVRGLHESVMSLDPTGREGAPRKRASSPRRTPAKAKAKATRRRRVR
jgi:hypothetical protein